jgi:hypothetical protein
MYIAPFYNKSLCIEKAFYSTRKIPPLQTLQCCPPSPPPSAVTRKKTVIKNGTFTVIHLLRCYSERQRCWVVYTVVQCNKASSCSLEGVGWGEGAGRGWGRGGDDNSKACCQAPARPYSQAFQQDLHRMGGGGRG